MKLSCFGRSSLIKYGKRYISGTIIPEEQVYDKLAVMKLVSKNVSTEVFNEAYASLNTSQKEAVDTIDGPVMVIAGPGTGKTQILTLRIANILIRTDTRAENVLALTFTESGAKAMRERLLRYIGPTAYQVPIFTFHGFASRLISEYPDAFPKVIGGRPATDIDRFRIIESILDNPTIKTLRPMGSPTYYVKLITNIISSLKKEYISPDNFRELISTQEVVLVDMPALHEKGAHKGKVRGEYTKLEKTITKNLELLFVYRHYELLLRERSLYDFEDMLIEAVHALENNEDMLFDVQETYQYLLADEHQDVNGSQNRLLELMASFHDNPNIFVVGDEKQAIYRFQGASLDNFLYFKDLYPNSKQIQLTENYRSGQNILDVAHDLVRVEDGPLKELRIALNASTAKSSSVTNREFSHQAIEDSWLVQEIINAISNGTEPNEIAVIVRTNQEVEKFSTLLRKQNIKVQASAEGDVLKHPITQAIQNLIAVAANPTNERALFEVVHGAYWGLDIVDLVKIVSERSYDTSLISILSDKDKLEKIGVKNIEKAYEIFLTLEEVRKKSVSEAPHRVLEFLLAKSGFVEHLIVHDPLEGVRVVRRLYDEVEDMVIRDGMQTLQIVSNALKTRLDYGLPLNAPYISTDTNAVQIMTAHKSKGLEFEFVFLPHLVDSSWGGGTRRNYFDIPSLSKLSLGEEEILGDEERLLYVGMTRAKSNLYLSSSQMNIEDKKNVPTRLLSEVNESLLPAVDTKNMGAEFDLVGDFKTKQTQEIFDKATLLSLVAKRGFSATSINNYLRSPWDYFYRNILRIPEVQPLHMQYGTVVHNVLERVTSHKTKEQKLPSDSQIKNWLEVELRRLPITTEEFTRLHEKGFNSLLTYIAFISPQLPEKTEEEFSLRVMLSTGIPELPELPLSGKLDRLDFSPNGNVLRVVDYKTGKARTRNDIEGKTKSSDGAYKRQLTFYALLLELYDDERYFCHQGTLSFVEADAKGKIHEETFETTRAEIDALKEEIINATKNLISGEFLKTGCDDSVSKYCHLVNQLQGRL